MPRVWAHVHRLPDGTEVGYSHKARCGYWNVVFTGPTGKRVEKATRHEARGKNPPPGWHDDAGRFIVLSYTPVLPAVERKGWDELLEEVRRHHPDIRPETFRSFTAAVKAVREVMPEVRSPLDITEDQVRRFDMLAKTTADGGTRSPATVSYYHRALSAFTNHLIPLGHLSRNPWRLVTAPKAKKNKRPAPAESQIAEFFAWVRGRYPDWAALHALLELKAVSASRTADLCKLRTAELQDGKLTFGADIVKTHKERGIPLPPDLYAALKAEAGPRFLWEGGLWEGIRRHRKQSNGLPVAFDWRTVYYLVNNLFREYSEAHPDQPRLTPHALRRRAITLTVIGLGGNVDAAANAIGVHPQTARDHYLDNAKAFQADADLKRVMAALRLNTPPVAGA